MEYVCQLINFSFISNAQYKRAFKIPFSLKEASNWKIGDTYNM